MKTALLPSVVSLVFLLACAPAQGPVPMPADVPADEDPGDGVVVDDGLDVDGVATGRVLQDQHQEPEEDQPEEPEEPEGLSWDPTEPDVPDGSTMETRFVCGFMQGGFDGYWEKQDGEWDLVGTNADPFPELIPCLGHGPERWFVWEPDGTIHFVMGGIEHLVEPTEVEDRWMGGAWTVDEPSEECQQGLEELGLSMPLTLQLNLVSIEEPTS